MSKQHAAQTPHLLHRTRRNQPTTQSKHPARDRHPRRRILRNPPTKHHQRRRIHMGKQQAHSATAPQHPRTSHRNQHRHARTHTRRRTNPTRTPKRRTLEPGLAPMALRRQRSDRQSWNPRRSRNILRRPNDNRGNTGNLRKRATLPRAKRCS